MANGFSYGFNDDKTKAVYTPETKTVDFNSIASGSSATISAQFDHPLHTFIGIRGIYEGAFDGKFTICGFSVTSVSSKTVVQVRIRNVSGSAASGKLYISAGFFL